MDFELKNLLFKVNRDPNIKFQVCVKFDGSCGKYNVYKSFREEPLELLYSGYPQQCVNYLVLLGGDECAN